MGQQANGEIKDIAEFHEVFLKVLARCFSLSLIGSPYF